MIVSLLVSLLHWYAIVVCYYCGLLLLWFAIIVVCYYCGLLLLWFAIIVVCYYCGLTFVRLLENVQAGCQLSSMGGALFSHTADPASLAYVLLSVNIDAPLKYTFSLSLGW